MEKEFDPSKYRSDLAEQIKSTKRKIDEEYATSEGENKDYLAGNKERIKRSETENILQLARWSEEYHRARLLKHGNYTTGENGEIIENETGLTTQQLADYEKLYDYFETNIADLLKTVEEQNIPETWLKSQKSKRAAKHLFWMEREYGRGVSIENASIMNKFAVMFGLEDKLKQAVEENLDIAIKKGDRAYATELLKAYPFFDESEVKKRLEARFYPMPEGLKDKIPAEELFGTALDSQDTIPNIALDRVSEILKDRAPVLVEDFKKDPYFYFELKECMSHNDRAMGYGHGRWKLRRDDKFGQATGLKDRNYVRAMFYLLGNPEAKSDFDKRRAIYNGPRIEFHFSADQDDARRDSDSMVESLLQQIFSDLKVCIWEIKKLFLVRKVDLIKVVIFHLKEKGNY
jgi:hypothetical protein